MTESISTVPVLQAMPPDLGAVPAIPHVTPASAMILARIDKQPAAIVPEALPHMAAHFRRRQQVSS